MAEDEQFWADQIARDIITRKTFHYLDKPAPEIKEYVVKTSASISGVLHIGRLSDTIRGSSVFRALQDQGVKARLIWVAEDMDPLRKVPEGVPKNYSEYIGMPVTDIPDPKGCHDSYAKHHVDEYFKVLDEFVQVKMEKFSMREEYKQGNFNDHIKTILENVPAIKAIQNKYRTNPLPEGWSPWTPICKNCKKIVTARIKGIKDGKVEYVCQDYQFESSLAKGCGHHGEDDPTKSQGKLLWKSEWAAQWSRWKIVSEGAGKEYQVPNSAWWINAEIVENVLDWPMPKPIFYEHLIIEGVKMSASLGNVVYPKDWLEIASPELLRFLYSKRLMKTRSLSWKDLPQLYDEYDHAGRVAFEIEEEKNEKEKSHLSRLYKIANFEQMQEPLQMSFSYAAALTQLYEEKNGIMDALKKTGHYQPLLEDKILERIQKAKNWLDKYAPNEVKFKIQTTVSKDLNLSLQQKEALHEIAKKLKEKEWGEKELSQAIYDIAKEKGVSPKDLYKAGYQVLLGQERGPRLASFLLILGDKAVKLFEKV